MNNGPRRKKSVYKSPKGIKNRLSPVDAFHVAKTTELSQLLVSTEINPTALKKFVDDYDNSFATQFPGIKKNTAQRNSLFKHASEKFLQLYIENLRNYSNNGKKTLADLVPLLDEFIRNFPEGENAFIHYHDSELFQIFSNLLARALETKIGDSDKYNLTTLETGGKNLCVEALLLQSLSKLPLAISTPEPCDNAPFRTNVLGELITTMIRRTTRYVTNGRDVTPTTLTMTTNALSHFDIDAFSTTETLITGLPPSKINKLIKEYVDACISKINLEKIRAEELIRLMHTICLLSPEASCKEYISSAMAQTYFKEIEQKINLTESSSSRSLANQLFILKNIYSDVFPPQLADKIAPYIEQFRAQAHDSRFEREVGCDILTAANKLAVMYPGLINPDYFNFDNPISNELGMESDIAYIDGDLKVCIQVDGDKYHRYPGSGVEFQKTKLRDYCFKQQGWKMIKFSDLARSASDIQDGLLKNIVFPSFELQTKQNIEKMQAATKDLQTLVLEASLESEKNELIDRLSKAILSAKFFTNAEAKLNQANRALPLLQEQKSQLAENVTPQSAKVAENKAELDATQQDYDNLNEAFDKAEAILIEENIRYQDAQNALNSYNAQTNTDKTITRETLRNAVEMAAVNKGKLQTALTKLGNAKKALKSKLAGKKDAYESAVKSLSALQQQLLENEQATLQNQDIITSIKTARSSPIIGTELLDAYKKFKYKVTTPMALSGFLNAKAQSFIPEMEYDTNAQDEKGEPMSVTPSEKDVTPAHPAQDHYPDGYLEEASELVSSYPVYYPGDYPAPAYYTAPSYYTAQSYYAAPGYYAAPSYYAAPGFYYPVAGDYRASGYVLPQYGNLPGSVATSSHGQEDEEPILPLTRGLFTAYVPGATRSDAIHSEMQNVQEAQESGRTRSYSLAST